MKEKCIPGIGYTDFHRGQRFMWFDTTDYLVLIHRVSRGRLCVCIVCAILVSGLGFSYVTYFLSLSNTVVL